MEMVESVDDLKYSRSIKRTHFELLDARIASALNKIIQNTRFKKKVSLEEMKFHKEDRFLRGRQIAYLMAREMGSPRKVRNRRRRTREGPEPACVQRPLQSGVAHGGVKDEFASCRGTVQSAWQYLQ